MGKIVSYISCMTNNPFTVAAKEILAMSDEELAKLFEDEPSDPFLEFTAECFVGTPVND